MHDPDGIDDILVLKLQMEVNGAGGRAGISLSLNCKSVQLMEASLDGASTVATSSGSAQTSIEDGTKATKDAVVAMA